MCSICSLLDKDRLTPYEAIKALESGEVSMSDEHRKELREKIEVQIASK